MEKNYYQTYSKLQEVNCNKNSKEWTVQLYRKSIDNRNSVLRCGDIIRIKNTA